MKWIFNKILFFFGLFYLLLFANIDAKNDTTKINLIEECLMPLLQERFNYDFDTVKFCDFFVLDGIPIENSPQYRNYHGYFCEGIEYVKTFWVGNTSRNLFDDTRDCKILFLKSLSFQKRKEKKEFIGKIISEGLSNDKLNVQYRVDDKIVENEELSHRFSSLKAKQVEIFKVYDNPNIIDENGKRVDKLIEIFLYK